MSPVTPEDTEAVLINANDPPCVAWKKFLKFLWLYYKWTKYRLNEDGEIADTWKNDLCPVAQDCPDTE